MQASREQSEAILHKDGPMLVIAGPGSGKTFVITKRLEYLLNTYHIPSKNILVITFTKAAALEMQQRFCKLTGNINHQITFGTFHAVYFHILKSHYHYTPQSIVKEKIKVSMIKELLLEQNVSSEGEETALLILKEISIVKNNSGEPDDYEPSSVDKDCFRYIYLEYEKRLRKNKMLDYDDMLLQCHRLLLEYKEVLQRWRTQYQYILIDEYQDISLPQLETIKLLSAPSNNLFAVGDDDQSIYGFRGAKPDIMLRFEEDFAGAKKVMLTDNYRCSKEITSAAGRLIVHNENRFKKNIKSAREYGDLIQYGHFPTRDEEYEALTICLAEEASRQDTAVIVRTNGQLGRIGEKLSAKGIPFVSQEKITNIYNHFIAEDIFSYFRLALGDQTRNTFLQVMNRPERNISRYYLKEERICMDLLIARTAVNQKVCTNLRKLQNDLTMLKTLPPFAAVIYIEKVIGYGSFLKEYASQGRIDIEKLLAVFEELKERSKAFESFQDWFCAVEDFEEVLKKERIISGEKSVRLMTMHASKGLEFSKVFIMDVNEGVTPYHKAVTSEAIEEERRMFYVAMTRAKNQLILMSAQESGGKKYEISRFEKEAMGEEKTSKRL